MIDPSLATVIDAYRTCEFATLSKDGAAVAWPTAAWRREDGSLLVTTSLAFARKALNVRRDGRVALLFSDPTGSGLAHPAQILITGAATCPDEVRTGPEGTEDYWRMLFDRQPHSRQYVRRPARWLMDWYYMRLHIAIAPDRVLELPPASAPTNGPANGPAGGPLGATLLASYPTAVLAGRDADGAPLLARTPVRVTQNGFAVTAAAGQQFVPGPASLLVHRHNDRLNAMHNAVVRGTLSTHEAGLLLVPERIVEPAGSGHPVDAVRTLREARKATARYLAKRGLRRPEVPWGAYRRLAKNP